MDNNAKEKAMLACAREMSRILPRIFDQPEQTITLMQRIADKYEVHPSMLGVTVAGIDQISALQQEVNELQAAQVRTFDSFEDACRAKGYVGDRAITDLVGAEPGRIRVWRQIGRVPVIFFHKLASMPEISQQRATATNEPSQPKPRKRQTEDRPNMRGEPRRQRDDRRFVSFNAEHPAFWPMFETYALELINKGWKFLSVEHLCKRVKNELLIPTMDDHLHSRFRLRFAAEHPEHAHRVTRIRPEERFALRSATDPSFVSGLIDRYCAMVNDEIARGTTKIIPSTIFATLQREIKAERGKGVDMTMGQGLMTEYVKRYPQHAARLGRFPMPFTDAKDQEEAERWEAVPAA